MENTELKEPEVTRYHIDIPNTKFRISYGYDPEEPKEHPECPGCGYYVVISNTETGNNILSRGISDCLTGPELLEIVSAQGAEGLIVQSPAFAEFKGKMDDIAAGLPI